MDDVSLVFDELSAWRWYGKPIVVIHGCAKTGADAHARKVVQHLQAQGLPYVEEPWPARWKEYGRAAGPIRNGQMVSVGKPDLGLAFWDGRVKGCGTLDCMQRLARAGIEFAVIPVKGKSA